MARTRLYAKSVDNDDVHTIENILKKLDSDLTDAEMKSYVDILLASPRTAALLARASLLLAKRRGNQEIEVLVLEEQIKAKEAGIELYKKTETYGVEEKIESMRKSINENISKLEKLRSQIAIGAARAEKLMPLVESSQNRINQVQSARPKWN